MLRRIVWSTGVIAAAGFVWYLFYSRPNSHRESHREADVARSVRRSTPNVIPANTPSDTRASGELGPESRAPFSREEAKQWLQDIVDRLEVPDMPLPALDLRPEDSASAVERAEILAARQHAEKAGLLLLVVRLPDGRIYYRESRSEFPRSFVPPHVRKHLTEHDWEVFQVAMEVASLRRDLARMAKSKQPSKAPEPTP